MTPWANIRRVPDSRLTRFRGQKPLVRIDCRRGAEQGNRGVAVEKHVLEVVIKFVVFEIEIQFDKVRIPRFPRLVVSAGGVAQPEYAVPTVIVVDMMGMDIEDELLRGFVVPLARGGLVFGFGGVDVVDLSEDLIHGEKRASHAAARAQVGLTVQALTTRVYLSVFLNQRLDLELLAGLGRRKTLSAGDNLCRHGGLDTLLIAAPQMLELLICEPV